MLLFVTPLHGVLCAEKIVKEYHSFHQTFVNYRLNSLQ